MVIMDEKRDRREKNGKERYAEKAFSREVFHNYGFV